MGSCCVSLAGLRFRLALNLQQVSVCIGLLSTRMTDVYHCAGLLLFTFFEMKRHGAKSIMC